MTFDEIESAWIGTGKRPGISISSDDDVFEIARRWKEFYQGLEEFC